VQADERLNYRGRRGILILSRIGLPLPPLPRPDRRGGGFRFSCGAPLDFDRAAGEPLPRGCCGKDDPPRGQSRDGRRVALLEQSINCALAAPAQSREFFFREKFASGRVIHTLAPAPKVSACAAWPEKYWARRGGKWY
jgi:hypothetical protein